MHPHQLPELRDYDFTIYFDGTIEIIGPLFELVQGVRVALARSFSTITLSATASTTKQSPVQASDMTTY